MDDAAFQRFLSTEGQAALAAATALGPTPANSLTCLTNLRKRFPADIATNAVEIALLRRKAAVKFARAAEMLFTRESLEMASSELVAHYRAKRFAKYSRVLDLGCGIGADTLALAAAGCRVTAIESDPVRLKMAEHNLAVYGLQAEFRNIDILTGELPPADAAFADPGRRAAGQRYLSLRDYLPPPDAVIARFPAGFPLAFKLAPGIQRSDMESLDGEVEFIEAEGELKECVLWCGDLGTPGRRATLLRANAEPATLIDDAPEYPGEAEPICKYLYDPAAAVVRAGLVPTLADQIGATPTDATVQMLSSNELAETPFATTYRVEAVLPFDAKKVQAWLKSEGIGRVTVVKRGALSDAAGTVEKWKLSGSKHRFLIVTRQQGDQVAVVAERTR